MPIATVSVAAERIPSRPPIATPAEKNAKTGTAKPLASGRNRCSRTGARPWAGSSSSITCGWVFRTGVAKPSSTPAIVAWMPLLYIRIQTTKPRGSRISQAAQARAMKKFAKRWVRTQYTASTANDPSSGRKLKPWL